MNQYVDVPFEASACPGVPVAPLESRNSPISERSDIVGVAKNEVPVA